MAATATIKAKLIFRNHKYLFSHDDKDYELLRSPITPQLIPGDTIEVDSATHSAICILEREPQTTIAIVRGISSGQAYLYCPLISPFYNPSIPLSTFQILVQIGTRLLVHITKDTMNLKKAYTPISDRLQDREIIDDLYNSSESC